MKIGVISDTHGFLDPQVEKLFAGVNHILHAGDIGFASIIVELSLIAPVTAVLGNTDNNIGYRLIESVELEQRKFLVHHIVNPWAWSETVETHIVREKPAAVVFGHTHKPFAETIDNVLFFNPGYSGKPKLGTQRSVAILHCDAQGIRHEFIPL